MNSENLCIAPNQIEEGVLLAYAAGESDTAVSQHVQSCKHCQNEVVTLQRLNGIVDDLRFRSQCPEPINLLRYTAALLPNADQQAIQQHSSTCPHCQAELQALAAAPSIIKENSPTRPSRLKRWQALGKEVIQAILQPPLQMAPALRGDNEGKESMYLTGTHQLVLSHKLPDPTKPLLQIEGQLTPLQFSTETLAGTAVLVQEEALTEVTINDLGYFSFSQVASDVYNIEIILKDIVLYIETIQT